MSVVSYRYVIGFITTTAVSANLNRNVKTLGTASTSTFIIDIPNPVDVAYIQQFAHSLKKPRDLVIIVYCLVDKDRPANQGQAGGGERRISIWIGVSMRPSCFFVEATQRPVATDPPELIQESTQHCAACVADKLKSHVFSHDIPKTSSIIRSNAWFIPVRYQL